MKVKRVSEEEVFLAFVHRAELIKSLLPPEVSEDEIVGLEIGVWLGDLLKHLLMQMPKIKRLYGIDPWIPCRTHGRLKPQDWWDEVYGQAVSNFVGEQRVALIRGKSQDVIYQVPNGLHFIEIDGEHTYEQVCVDLRISLPKLVAGGLLCGHDCSAAGVKKAVEEFADLMGREVRVREEDVGMWWYV